jgi:hypothetical protein
MSTAAKVAIHKREHPEYYCRVPRCLWRTVVCDPITREMKPAKNCVDGYCPRHADRAGADSADALERIRRAGREKEMPLISALRKNGVL